jgi:hypothetical protein
MLGYGAIAQYAIADGPLGAVIPPIPPVPVTTESFHGGGFGSSPYRKDYRDQCEERRELAADLRDALEGRTEPDDLPQVSEARAVRLDIDPRISQLLSRAEDAPMAQYEALIRQALAAVEDAIREDDDIECLLMGL